MPQSNRRPWLDAVAAGVVLQAATAALLWPALVCGEVVTAGDLIYHLDPVWRAAAPAGFDGPSNELLSDEVYQFYPWAHFAARHEGGFPLWNPYSYAGQPLLANAQSGLFSPFRLVTLALPLPWALSVALLLRLEFAGLSTYLLARQLGLGQLAAILAMVAFTLSAPVVVWLSHPHSHVYVWLPAALWLTERLVHQPRWSDTAALGLVLGAQFLGGHPETSFHLLVAWTCYVCFREVTAGDVLASTKALWRLGVALLLGLALGAIQLLPFLAYLPETPMLAMRAAERAGVGWSNLLGTWQRWPGLATAILPRVFGTPIDRSYWYPYSNYNESNIYVGVVPLALALIAVAAWWRREGTDPQRRATACFALLAFGALGIAMQLPLLALLDAAPVFNLAANGRLSVVYALSLSLLAGLGLQNLLDRSSETAWRRLGWAGVGLTLTALVTIAALATAMRYGHDRILAHGQAMVEQAAAQPGALLPRDPAYYREQVHRRLERMRDLFHWHNPATLIPLLAGAALWLAARYWRRSGAQGGGAWLVAVTLLDLLWAHRGYQPTLAPAPLFPATEITRYLSAHTQKELSRVGALGLALMPNSAMVFDLADVRGYDPMAPRRYIELIARVPGYVPVSYYVLWRAMDSPLFDLLNVRYLVAEKGQRVADKWQPVFADTSGTLRIYRNDSALPRAFVVTKAVRVSSPQASLEQVLAPSFDFRTQVVLEGEAEPQPGPATPPAATVVLQEHTPDRMVLLVTTAQPGYLVLTDTYAPGWEALVADERRPVLIANHAFRAVRVPAGSHRVELAYTPPGFVIGAWLSALALAACVLILAASFVTRAKAP